MSHRNQDDDDTTVADVAISRTFTPSLPGDNTDERLMVGLLRSMKQEMMAEFALNRERFQRLHERIEALSIDIEAHLKRPLRSVGKK